MNQDFILKVLIVEDDFSFALELQMLIEELGYTCSGIVDDSEKALALIANKKPDIILMDIDINGEKSGLELAEDLKDYSLPVLFISSSDNQATHSKAKEIGMIGFLVKPLSKITLLTILDLFFNQIEQQRKNRQLDIGVFDQSLLIKRGGLYHKVDIDNIIHISSDMEYATIFTTQGKFMFRESLKKLEARLDKNKFFRSHQSHIINFTYLKSIQSKESVAIMSDETQVPISRRNRTILEGYWKRVGY